MSGYWCRFPVKKKARARARVGGAGPAVSALELRHSDSPPEWYLAIIGGVFARKLVATEGFSSERTTKTLGRTATEKAKELVLFVDRTADTEEAAGSDQASLRWPVHG